MIGRKCNKFSKEASRYKKDELVDLLVRAGHPASVVAKLKIDDMCRMLNVYTPNVGPRVPMAPRGPRVPRSPRSSLPKNPVHPATGMQSPCGPARGNPRWKKKELVDYAVANNMANLTKARSMTIPELCKLLRIKVTRSPARSRSRSPARSRSRSPARSPARGCPLSYR